MQIKIGKKNPKKCGLLIIPLFEDKSFNSGIPADLVELREILEKRSKKGDFKAKEGDSMLIVPDSDNLPAKVLLCGMGKTEKLTSEKVRENSASFTKKAKHYKEKNPAMILSAELAKHPQALAEGLALADYSLGKYQTGENKKKNEESKIQSFEIISDSKIKTLSQDLQKGLFIADAVNETRDLVNGPNNFINPDTLPLLAKKAATKSGAKLTVLNKQQLEKLKMGALLGVNKGSARGAKLLIFDYKPRGAKSVKNPIMIVGKGVTFDSGGYNLKPSSAIENMKEDMAGSAVVMGIFSLLKKLKIKHRVIGIAPLTDNMIGGKAQAVNDIVTAYNGKTIEITNTDAEGRLILADAIAYGVKKFNPGQLIDLATLTGACMVALGDRYAGLFGNNQKLIDSLKDSGENTGELVWHLPLHKKHSEEMKSKIADLHNSSSSGLAGASKGAAFIKEFIGKTDWAHLDIAGVTFVKDPKPYDFPAATGYGVRLLVDFLERLE